MRAIHECQFFTVFWNVSARLGRVFLELATPDPSYQVLCASDRPSGAPAPIDLLVAIHVYLSALTPNVPAFVGISALPRASEDSGA
jgi:hypothetical protein